MSDFPKIKTAIPRRRYHYGDYLVTVLGEVESADANRYRYIAAFVREGEGQPQLYVTAQQPPIGHRAPGAVALRLVGANIDEIMDVDERWQDIQQFVEQALQLGSQVLGLEQEIPYQIA